MFRNTLKFFLRSGCFVLLGCFIAGCGIKGPLYLPQDKETSATAPATAPASQDATK